MSTRPLSAKQIRFALLIVEGETQSKAYELAGYSVKNSAIAATNASVLMKNPKVAEFIAKQQAKAAERNVITVESLTADLIDIRDKAKAAGSFGPAVAAVQVIARINGLMIDKSEVTIMNKPAPLPTKIIELSEDDWVRQFGQGLQEKRLTKLEALAKKK